MKEPGWLDTVRVGPCLPRYRTGQRAWEAAGRVCKG